MAITSFVFFEVTRKTWKWAPWKSYSLLVLFLSFDIPFFAVNVLKFVDGGYIPISVGLVFFIVMLNWKKGRQLLRDRLEKTAVPMAQFAHELEANGVARIPGVAIYLTGTSHVPHVLRLQSKRTRSVAEHVILLMVAIEHDARLDEARRFEVEHCTHGFIRVLVRFGYLEIPDLPPQLTLALRSSNVALDITDATYYIGRESLLAGPGGHMKPLAEGLFAFLSRNSKSPTLHYQLPPDQVIELGTQIYL